MLVILSIKVLFKTFNGEENLFIEIRDKIKHSVISPSLQSRLMQKKFYEVE